MVVPSYFPDDVNPDAALSLAGIPFYKDCPRLVGGWRCDFCLEIGELHDEICEGLPLNYFPRRIVNFELAELY